MTRIVLGMIAVLALCLNTGCDSRIRPIADLATREAGQLPDYDGMKLEDLKKVWGEPARERDLADEQGICLWECTDGHIAVRFVGNKVVACYRATYMQVKVLEVSGDSVLVQPLSPDFVKRSGDKLCMNLSWFAPEDRGEVCAGSLIDMEFDGVIMESYPMQMNEPFLYWITR